MATTESLSCRICCSFLSSSHCIAVFPDPKRYSSDLAKRLSRVIEVPITPKDGLSQHICRPCNRKFLSAESFRVLAKASYEKSRAPLPRPLTGVTGSPTSTRVVAPRKRSKDTSGVGVSPHTHLARPSAKRQTVGATGRRLCFPVQDNITAPSERDVPLRHRSNVTQGTSVEISHETAITQQPNAGIECRPQSTSDSTATDIHSVKISVYSPSKRAVCTVVVSPDLKKIAKALAGGNVQSICRAVFATPHLRNYVVARVSRIVNDECSVLCSKSAKPVSLFRSMTLEQAERFTWTQAIIELETKAPTLYEILGYAVSNSSKRNKKKKGERQFPGLCTALAILLKERNRVMCGVQSYLSSALFSTHIQKKAWSRLNHVNVTLSYEAILKRVKKISEGHTKVFDKWLREGAFVKFVGDNVDKQVNVRDIRSDHHGRLVHMFSIFTIKARVSPPAPVSDFSCPTLCTDTVECFLPTKEDITVIQGDLEVLVSRVLCDYVKGFHELKSLVTKHIPHTYSEEMAAKSEVVVLDVLHNNEMVSSDMVDIMRAMVSYLGPHYKHTALSGGDHLTCEREQCAKRHVQCSNSPGGRIDNLEPCIEDWHCVMNFMILIWQKLYKASQEDYGSLNSIFARIGRSKAKKPKDDMHTCQDALLTVFKGHMVAAACTELGIEGPDGEINGKEVNQALLSSVAQKVVREFTVIPEALLGEPVVDSGDHVYGYARVLCHFASLVLLFVDAWKEGDGERVLRLWKILMLHFHAERKTKYALEALRLQFQVATLQPYLSHQLIWGRFVNTHGGQGRNLPCDLHNEHINKLFKDIISNMGANFSKAASTWAARSVSSLETLSIGFDKQTGIHPEATAHSKRTDEKDVKTVVDVLQKADILKVTVNRCHRMFPKFSPDPLHKLNRQKMTVWIKRKAREYTRSEAAMRNDSDTEDAEPSHMYSDSNGLDHVPHSESFEAYSLDI